MAGKYTLGQSGTRIDETLNFFNGFSFPTGVNFEQYCNNLINAGGVIGGNKTFTGTITFAPGTGNNIVFNKTVRSNVNDVNFIGTQGRAGCRAWKEGTEITGGQLMVTRDSNSNYYCSLVAWNETLGKYFGLSMGDDNGLRFFRNDNGVLTNLLQVKNDGDVVIAGALSDGVNSLSIQDIANKEDMTNKVTSISASSTDTQYPSAKCVYDKIETKYVFVETTSSSSSYTRNLTEEELIILSNPRNEIICRDDTDYILKPVCISNYTQNFYPSVYMSQDAASAGDIRIERAYINRDAGTITVTRFTNKKGTQLYKHTVNNSIMFISESSATVGTVYNLPTRIDNAINTPKLYTNSKWYSIVQIEVTSPSIIRIYYQNNSSVATFTMNVFTLTDRVEIL